jgi:fluoride exporter
MNIMALMYVALGGAFGSMCRYVVMSLVGRFHVSEFPYGTLAVNVLGAFLMGLWIAAMATLLPAKAKDLHLLFAVGVLGGFTTFSTFTLDVFLLFERGLVAQGIVYILGSVGATIAALLAGMWCVRLAGG